ncbi:MAG: DUF2071 domain-containing protein [Planctomycetota bacterium]
MRIPVIRGIIDRRILVNFRVSADVMAQSLPAPFRPKLAAGYAIAGICLIRLKSIGPRFLPLPFGIASENAAHRIAVEWEIDGRCHEGVYVPRRDTSSRLNAWLGGTLFPGLHHHASFVVHESDGGYSVAYQSDDGQAKAVVSGTVVTQLPASSVFRSLAEASSFFEKGSLGYSVTKSLGRYDGIELRCRNWKVEPLQIDRIESSYFENETLFPKGSVEFDHALLMRGIRHEWHGREDLCCAG